MTTENPGGNEASPNGVVRRNLEMLRGHVAKEGGSESIGGNASSRVIDGVRYSCYAINGYADPATGEVLEYGNDLANKHNLDAESFSLRLGVPRTKDPADFYDRLIEAVSGEPNGTLSPGLERTLMSMKDAFEAESKAALARDLTSMRAKTEAPITNRSRSTIDKLLSLFGRPPKQDQ